MTRTSIPRWSKSVTGSVPAPVPIRVRRVAFGLVVGVVAAMVSVISPIAPVPAATAAQSPAVCNANVALSDGGFETPVIPANSFRYIQDAQVDGWSTTATDKNIELWSTGYNGVPSATGNQFAEINATQSSTLYQDVPTTPGQTLRWQLQHRGRAGVDTMAVLIGSPTALVNQSTISDGNTAWGTYSALYLVPPGQTTTRFAFQSISTATGDNSVGNFLDSISFGTGACLVTTKTVTDASGSTTAKVGDTLTYSVTTNNGGGNPATNTVITDNLPAGLAYVPGSITATTSTGTVSSTDAAGDDQGEYDSANRRIVVRTGTSATATAGGSIAAGESRTISFQAVVASAAALTTLNNAATTTFTDPLSGQNLTSTSNTTSTPVSADADLGVTQSLTTAVVAGTPASYSIVVTNNGPQDDTGVTLTSTLPASNGVPTLTGVTAPGCTVSGSTLSCAVGALANGASRTFVVTGTIPSTTPPGTSLVLSSHVTGALHDAISSNDTATTTTPTTESADVGISLTSDTTNPVAGQSITYTATATNSGPSQARAVTFTDPLESGDVFVSATIPGGTCTFSAPIVTCSAGNIAVGASAVATIRVTAAPAGGGAVSNTVSVSSPTPDPALGNNSANVSYNGTSSADVGVQLSLGGITTANAGDTVNYSVVITNNGPSTAVNVTPSTVLPAGITVTSRTQAQGYCTPTACLFPSIAPGQSYTITGTAHVDATAPAGPASATTTITSSTPDPVSSNNASRVDFTILLSADLALTQSNVVTTVRAGDTVAETVTVTNNGPTRAENLSWTSPIPAGGSPSFTSNQGGTCTVSGLTQTCTLAVLPAGQQWIVNLSGVIPSSTAADTVTLSHTVTSTTPDPNTANNTSSTVVTVTQVSDLSITKTTSTPNVIQTGAIAFLVTVTNNGPSDAQNVFVREQPQPGVVVTGTTPSAGSYDDPTGAWRIPALVSGASATLQVQGSAQGSGVLENDATAVSSGGTDPNTSNNTASATVNVTPAARSLSLTTTPTVTPAADQNGVRTGDTIAYSYTVTNTGNVAMSAISVMDPRVGSVSCPSAALAPGASMTCSSISTYRVTQADFDNGQGVTNTPTVSGAASGGGSPVTYGPATSTVPVAAAAPALSATKVANFHDTNSNGALDAGETIEWTVLVSNPGDVTLANLTVADPVGGAVSCPSTVLDPGASVSCTMAVHTITSGESGGQVTNTATASANNPRGGPAIQSAPASVTTPTTAAPAISIITSGVVSPANGSGAARYGDSVVWHYAVTNTGNVRLTGVVVNDPDGGMITCDSTTLQPGQTAQCVGGTAHAVVETDVLAGSISNSATASGTPVASAAVTSAPSTANVPVEAIRAGIAIAVSLNDLSTADPTATAEVGDLLRAQYVVTNTGNVTLTNIGVSDPTLGANNCPSAPLAPGASVTCQSAPHTVTDQDARAGSVQSSATAAGAPPAASGQPPRTASGSATHAVDPGPGALTITTTPTADPAGHGVTGLVLGDTVGYSYLVTNTGNATMTGITVTDSLIGAVSCPSASLAPGASETCVGVSTYRVTQADFDSGLGVTNSASVTGSSAQVPGGATFGPATSSVPIAGANPSLSAQKIANFHDTNNDQALTAGETIDWTVRATNTGDVTLSGLDVADPVGGTASCPVTVLAPGASVNCTLPTHTVTSGEAGTQVTNTATVSADNPRGGARIQSNSASVTTPSSPAPAIGILTSGVVQPAEPGNVAKLGDAIFWHYVVTNTGNVRLSAVTVNDPEGGAITCNASVLDPGDSANCVGATSHQVTEADILAGSVTNAATATGTPVTPGPVTSPASTATVGVAAKAAGLSATVVVTDSTTGTSPARAGDSLQAVVTVRNSGNVTLSGIQVTDATYGSTTCIATVLPPGASTTCTADNVYTVTDADARAGKVSGTASAHGTPPAGSNLPTTVGSATSTVIVDPGAGVLVITTTPRVNGAAAIPVVVGDTVSYSYLVTNTGNATMTGIAVSDTLVGAASCPVTSLAPGASVTCTSSTGHLVSQTEFDSGAGVTNSALVVAASAAQAMQTFGPASSTVPDGPASPALTALTVADFHDTNGDGALTVGETIDWTVIVTNTGTVTVTGIVVSDPIGGTVSCPTTTLAPGASVSCTTATHTVTSAEDGGTITNTASASGTPARGGSSVVSNSSSVTTPQLASPAILLVTSGVVLPGGSSGPADFGQQIQWRYTVTNTGNVSVSAITINDPDGGAITCDRSTIAPGQSAHCEGASTHTVTEADVLARSVSNSATATATGSSGGPAASGVSTATVPTAAARAALSLVTTVADASSAGSGDPIRAGDTLRADYVVTNSGNVTLTQVSLADQVFGPASCSPTTLAPGDAATCTSNALYTVTAQDVAAGQVLSSATAAGTPPSVSNLQLVTLALVTPFSLEDPGSSPAAAQGALAVTGATVGSSPWLALLALLVGLVMVLRAGRRRPGRHSS